jgi:hypothetical protein
MADGGDSRRGDGQEEVVRNLEIIAGVGSERRRNGASTPWTGLLFGADESRSRNQQRGHRIIEREEVRMQRRRGGGARALDGDGAAGVKALGRFLRVSLWFAVA